MAKLNPPHLNNKLPSFYVGNNFSLNIPFELNRSVGISEFNKMKILIKSISSGVEKYSGESSSVNKENGVASFSISTNTFNPQIGQYYKIQLAFIHTDNTVGYYSSAATIKCTAQPSISIQNLNINSDNNNKYTYTGYYENDDSNEKVYSYCFNMYEENGNLYETSGILIHKYSEEESITSSIDTWTPTKGLAPGKNYNIEYKVKTLNDMEVSTSLYRITNNHLIPPPGWFDGTLQSTLCKDDGYIEVAMKGDNLYGNFILSRSSSKDNFEVWHRITEFTVANAPDGIVIWKDFTIEQGIEYSYAIQMKNDNEICTGHIIGENKKIMADFEDMFLFDGKRQLKIRFNPKVTSFKNTMLESKVDTIGSQFPFFFRNSSVSYKEFPISGLISMLMDDNELFITDLQGNKIIRQHTPNNQQGTVSVGRTQLTAENVGAEREFKLEVLRWLQNGELKLFRSPGEGNYIVRLLNISMSPNDTLSRMIHTFSCTAYEAMEYNFENLKKQKYLNIDEVVNLESYHVTTDLTVVRTPYNGIIVEGKKVSCADSDQVMNNVVISNMIPLMSITVNVNGANQTYTSDAYGVVEIPSCKSFEFNSLDNLSLSMAILDFDFIGNLSNYPNWRTYEGYSSTSLNSKKITNLYSSANWNSQYVDTSTHLFDYLSYLNNTNGKVGEVQYIYFRKRKNLSQSDVSNVNTIIQVSSHNKDIEIINTPEGKVYRNCGFLSEFKCGNGLDIDISYFQQSVS